MLVNALVELDFWSLAGDVAVAALVWMTSTHAKRSPVLKHQSVCLFVENSDDGDAIDVA